MRVKESRPTEENSLVACGGIDWCHRNLMGVYFATRKQSVDLDDTNKEWRLYSLMYTPTVYIIGLGTDLIFQQVSGGYLEGIVRGYKSGILNANQYHNLTQCETLEGLLSILNVN
jgi:hypothetical protein